MTGAQMDVSKIDFVRGRIASGDQVRIYHDFYGGQWIELRPRWQFWRKKRLQLAPRELAAIKTALKGAPRTASTPGRVVRA